MSFLTHGSGNTEASHATSSTEDWPKGSCQPGQQKENQQVAAKTATVKTTHIDRVEKDVMRGSGGIGWIPSESHSVRGASVCTDQLLIAQQRQRAVASPKSPGCRCRKVSSQLLSVQSSGGSPPLTWPDPSPPCFQPPGSLLHTRMQLLALCHHGTVW